MVVWKMPTKWVPLDELKAAAADKIGLVDGYDVCAHIKQKLEHKAFRMRGKQ